MYQYYETQVIIFQVQSSFSLSQYLGAAHGLTGILQMLLSVPGYFQVILTPMWFECCKVVVFDTETIVVIKLLDKTNGIV